MQIAAAFGQLPVPSHRAASRKREGVTCTSINDHTLGRRDLSAGDAIPATSNLTFGRRELLAGAATLTASNLFLGGAGNAAIASEGPSSIYSFSGTLNGEEFPFSQYRDKYGDQGFALVAVSCNQFGGQAPGTDEEERQAAYRKFGRDDFPVLDHMMVNGPDTHPLYRYLKSVQPLSLPSAQGAPPGMGLGKETGVLEWNYVKFLIDRQGVPAKRFKPGFDPMEFEGDVKMLLAGKSPLPAECIAHPGRKVCNVDNLLAESA